MSTKEIIYTIQQTVVGKTSLSRKFSITVIGLFTLANHIFGKALAAFEHGIVKIYQPFKLPKHLLAIVLFPIYTVIFLPLIVSGWITNATIKLFSDKKSRYSYLALASCAALAANLFWFAAIPAGIYLLNQLETNPEVKANPEVKEEIAYSSPTPPQTPDDRTALSPTPSAPAVEPDPADKQDAGLKSDEKENGAQPSSGQPADNKTEDAPAVTNFENPPESLEEARQRNILFDINSPITYQYSLYYPSCLAELGYGQPFSGNELADLPNDMQNCIYNKES